MPPNITKALSLIDAAHSLDPNLHTTTTDPSTTTPYELHYAQRTTHYLHQHTSSPSPLLLTACRAQHFRRWEVPRSSYPAGKPGYFAWRTYLKHRQAEQIKEICLECDYTEDEANHVAKLIAKEDLKRGEGNGDPEAQVLEDVACLVFLDDQFDEFEKGHDEEKMVGILRKTWGKMGDRGRELALGMELSERARMMITKALEGS
jgi:hypothetical protein